MDEMKTMTPEQLIDSRLAAERAILLRAQQDPQFRALLKADPKRALKETFGLNWEPGVTLEVVEESSSRALFVLPPLIEPANDDELSDEDLERVAGSNNHQQPPICYTNRFGVEQCKVPNAEGGT